MGGDQKDDRGRRRERSKSGDRKHRKKKSSRHFEEDDESSERRHRKHPRKRQRDDERESRQRAEERDSDEELSREERHRERKKKKKSKKEKKKDRKRHESSDETSSTLLLEQNFAFVDALHNLLEAHPRLSSDLPVILVRMAGGATFDLGQMPDRTAAAGLKLVFRTLSSFGVGEDEKGSWGWKAPDGGGKGNHDLFLVRVARALLDKIGITLEAVQNYDKKPAAPTGSPAEEESIDNNKPFSPLQKQALDLLGRFERMDSTLPKQLSGICNLILEGECVSIDGIPDDSLRTALETLFQGAGLERSEMEDEDEEDGEQDNEPSFGYSLPESMADDARTSISAIVDICNERRPTRSQERLKGPLPQSMADQYSGIWKDNNGNDDDDDDEGPAPIGSMRAKKRGPSLPPEIVQAMAERRKQELAELGSGSIQGTNQNSGREEWMLEPGEHDILQGIKSGSVMKNRNFENKKVSGADASVAKEIDPSVKAQVDAIIHAHNKARGPSLMQQHQKKKAAEKEAKKGKKSEWTWSREQDLDSGRRVDKEALRMIMGGAGNGLKDKFQGGLSSG